MNKKGRFKIPKKFKFGWCATGFLGIVFVCGRFCVYVLRAFM